MIGTSSVLGRRSSTISLLSRALAPGREVYGNVWRRATFQTYAEPLSLCFPHSSPTFRGRKVCKCSVENLHQLQPLNSSTFHTQLPNRERQQNITHDQHNLAWSMLSHGMLVNWRNRIALTCCSCQ